MRGTLRTSLWLLIALLGGAWLYAPSSTAFSVNGSTLSLDKRHFRVFNNFADPEANNQLFPQPQFPGATGAEAAIWKGFMEWCSVFHGNGGGDPTGNIIGQSGANIDFSWQGNASGIGEVGDNVVSAITSCSGAVVAFTENSPVEGWRIRFCDNGFVWEDGPDLPQPGNYDIQGMAVHLAGHALGLDHGNANSVMRPLVIDGSESRDLTSDDWGGAGSIYGPMTPTKPRVTNVFFDVNAGTLTILGWNFHPTQNEIWFTNASVTDPAIDPTIRSPFVPSVGGGTQITVSVPPDSGSGDILVRVPGGAYDTISNPYPAFFVYIPGNPTITSIAPTVVEAVDPGNSPNVIINGADFSPTTTVRVGGVDVPSLYLGSNQIAFDMPLVGTLGGVSVEVIDGPSMDAATIQVVEPAAPVLQLNDGELNTPVIPNVTPVNLAIGGPVGSAIYTVYSSTNLPSVFPGIVSLDLGNNFSDIPLIGIFTVGPEGYAQASIGTIGNVPPGAVFYAQGASLTSGFPLQVTNLQSLEIQ